MWKEIVCEQTVRSISGQDPERLRDACRTNCNVLRSIRLLDCHLILIVMSNSTDAIGAGGGDGEELSPERGAWIGGCGWRRRLGWSSHAPDTGGKTYAA